MNAAFLLLTSAWLTGQTAAPPPPPPRTTAPAPATAMPAPIGAYGAYGAPGAGCGASCGGDCNACCDDCGGGKGGLFGKFRGLFNKGGGDCCDDCGGGKGGRLRGLFNKGGGCDCGSTCDSCDDGCGKQGLFSRLKGKFRKGGDCCDDCCGSAGCGAAGCGGPAYGAPAYGPGGPIGPRPEQIAPPKEQPRPMPGTSDKAKQVQILTPEAPKAVLTSGTETKNPFELNRRYESRVAHAPDYSCLTGQLFFVHADGGLWVLRYAPLWQEDPNGGSIVLARDLRMDNYREGDLVSVRGEILRQKSSVFLGGPLYRARSIELIERDAK